MTRRMRRLGLGIPLALVVLALFMASLALSVVTIACWLGERVRRLVSREAERPTGLRRWLWMSLGFIVLALVSSIPVIGPLVTLFAMLVGLGAFAGQAWPRFRAPTPVAAPA